MTDTIERPTRRRRSPAHGVPTVAARPAGPGPMWVPLAMFAAVAIMVWFAVWLGNTHVTHDLFFPSRPGIAGGTLFEGWQRWDAYWYRTIVREGYVYYPGVQSSVAFWPSYPIVVKTFSWAFPSIFITGSVVSFVSGAISTVLVRRWAGLVLPRAAAVTTVALMLVYPYGYYKFGAVYADSLCLAATLGAFVLLERDRMFWAGVLGIVASAARPAGLVIAVVLVLRVLERRNLERGATTVWQRFDPRGFRLADSPILLAFAGVGTWAVYLWIRFGDPLLFATIEGSKGWDQGAGPSTWFKVTVFRELQHDPLAWSTIGHVVQGLLLIGALALVPRVIRRFGWAYGAYVVGLAALALIGTKDFQSSGRYILGAFPCFAVLAELLVRRPPLRFVILVMSLLALLCMGVAYGRGSYLS